MSGAAPPPDRPAPPRRRRARVLLLGLIGALALVLPLTQVLRFQVDGLLDDEAALARIDPLVEAVAVQRGLIDHDDVAARVLRGRSALEGERRLRQAVVDHHLAALRMALPSALSRPARREAESLKAGWTDLVQAIAERRIDEPASRRGHRLLQEQAVQVMDLVHAGAGAAARADPSRRLAELQALRTELDRRITRQRATRDLAGSALALLLLMTAAAGAAWWRTAARGEAGAGPDGGVRRGHGRRAGDRPAVLPPAALAAREIDALQRGVEDARSGG